MAIYVKPCTKCGHLTTLSQFGSEPFTCRTCDPERWEKDKAHFLQMEKIKYRISVETDAH